MASMSTPELPIQAPIQAPLGRDQEHKAMRQIAIAAILVGGGGIINFPVGQLNADPPALKWLSKPYTAACFACFATGLVLLAISSSMPPTSSGGTRWLSVFKKLKWFVLALVVLVVTMRAALVLAV